MKTHELNALSDEQLVHKELDLERSLTTFSFRHRLQQLENTSQLGKARRDIARAETALTAREKAAGLNKGALKARYRSSWSPSAPQAADQEAGAGFLKGMLDKPDAAE